MAAFIDLLYDFFGDVFGVLGSFTFDFAGMNVSLLSLLLALGVVGMVVTVFWGGTKY